MRRSMKQMILIAVFLFSTVQSKYIDYCKIERKACAFHDFEIGENDPNDNFTCLIQPLKYNASDDINFWPFEPYGEQERHAPTAVNETSIRCELKGIQSANVILENGQGVALDTAFLYPTLCILCYEVSYCAKKTHFRGEMISLYGISLSREEGGCFIDNMCHPHQVINPANHSQWCSDRFHTYEWTDIAYGHHTGQGANGMSVHFCRLLTLNWEGAQKGNITRASVPEFAGTEGLDLTADGAIFNVFSNYVFNIDTNFKIYVKFGTEPITETETFFEVPFMLKIKRTPDEDIIAEYTFLDFDANRVIKVVPLTGDAFGNDETGWLQLIGIKMKVDHNRKKREETVKWIKDDWNMIGFHYDLYGGVPALKWYLNGKEIEVDHGNITGLYLRGDHSGPLLSHGQFSCFEILGHRKAMENYDFFTNPNLTSCMEQYKMDVGTSDPDARFSSCESQYYRRMG